MIVIAIAIAITFAITVAPAHQLPSSTAACIGGHPTLAPALPCDPIVIAIMVAPPQPLLASIMLLWRHTHALLLRRHAVPLLL
jgi:hypothetical protein